MIALNISSNCNNRANMSQPQSLLDSPNDETKSRIAYVFFAGTSFDPADAASWQEYFTYYEREIRRLSIGVVRSTPGTIPGLAAKTHDDISHISQVLSRTRMVSRDKVRDELLSRFRDSDSVDIDRAVDLTVRLWLMINIRDDDMSVRMPQKNAIQWEDDVSLSTLIATHLPTSLLQVPSRQSRLSPQFTVANMVKLCGLQLKWTESLEDHLRLDRRSKELWIFSYKDFLLKHMSNNLARKLKNGTPQSAMIFSPAFLRETITTLNLLFPHWDPDTQDLLSKHNQNFHTIPPFAGPRRLDLGEFNYWRDALFELYEEVYLAPADSWRQLWVDRRNPHQWYTFWIALVVLILSVVSCVTSIIQAWASVAALKLQTQSGHDGG